MMELIKHPIHVKQYLMSVGSNVSTEIAKPTNILPSSTIT